MIRGTEKSRVASTAWAGLGLPRVRSVVVGGAVFVLLVFGAVSSALAQNISSSVGTQTLAITFEDCLSRAKKALDAEGYRAERSGNIVRGTRGIHRATILCDETPHSDRKIDVHVFVATASSDGSLAGAERTKLQSTLGAALPPTTKGNISALPLYASTERVTVYYSGLPGNEYDWVSVVPAGAADNNYVGGQWEFTNGKKSGSFEMGPLPVGRYEARTYFDWNTGSYEVRGRYSFEVRESSSSVRVATPDGPAAIRARELYKPAEKVVVEYSGLPGNESDWVSVVPAGADDNNYAPGQWEFTEGKKSGSFTVGPLPAGRYEARVYFNWSTANYEVRARYNFEVRE
jgi:hypothetical protein